MNKNMKIVLKLIVVIVILLNLPFQNIYSESVENVVSSLTTTNVQKQLNGKSIYIYNTHQGEKYATKSVKEGSRYLVQLLENKGYEVDYETTDFELYKTKNHIDYAKSYTVSQNIYHRLSRNMVNTIWLLTFIEILLKKVYLL